jgi:hypothetical protein
MIFASSSRRSDCGIDDDDSSTSAAQESREVISHRLS